MRMDEDYGPSSSNRPPRGGYGGRNNYNNRNYSRNFEQENRYPGGGRYSNDGFGRGGGRYQNHNYNSSYNNGYSNSRNDQWSNNRGGSSNRGRGSGYWGGQGGRSGTSSRGRGRSQGGRFEDPGDIAFLKSMRGHTDGITAMAFDENTGQLFTGSKDRTVRLWDYQTGQCNKTVEVGGEVDSMLLEAGILFVAIHTQAGGFSNAPGVIKVYNLQDGAEHELQGHKGPIYCLAAASNMLFSGAHDNTIRVWNFNQATAAFEFQAELSTSNNGHAAAVSALHVIGNFMFSADYLGGIKVWDLGSGQCVQTIEKAHQNVVMSLLAWEGFLLSGSIDGSIRIWQPSENPGPNSVVDPAPTYTHPPTGEAMFGRILALSGTTDAQGKAILLSSYSEDEVIRLWQLPDFADRGHLNAIRNSRAVLSGQGHLFAGDYLNGAVKVWKWK